MNAPARRVSHSCHHICRAYKASVAEFETGIQDSVAFLRQRWGLKVGDPVPPTTADETGETVDFQDDVDNLTDESEACLRIVRASFVVTLFQYWERHSFLWLKTPVSGSRHYDQGVTMEWLRNNVGQPENVTIDKLRLVADALKHGPGRSPQALYESYPELFRPSFGLGQPSDAPLLLDKAVIASFFSIIDRSAPREK